MARVSDVTAFPLSWPIDRPRTPAHERQPARFSQRREGRLSPVTIATACDRIWYELERLGATDIVASTNIEVRLDGSPRSGRRAPTDPGAAVYFKLEGQDHCLSCDKWDDVAGNLAAIAAHVEALRGQLRWGVADVRRAFAGFRALPAPAPWWRVLGLEAPPSSAAALKAQFRRLARSHHPDVGGNEARMAEIGEAYARGLAELGARGS
jgi:hypothetical protein